MARISRKELKKDQFVTEVSRTYQFLQQHRTALILLLIAVVLVMVLGLGGYFYVQNRKARANEELAHAIRVFYAPTSSENPQTEPDMKFSDEEARYRQAEKEFAAIAQKYGWLAKLRFGDQPRMARYYLGLTKQHLGQTEEAMRELRTLAEQEQDQQLAPLARFALAGIYVQNGKPDEAEKLYRELADRPGELISPGNGAANAGRALERAEAGGSRKDLSADPEGDPGRRRGRCSQQAAVLPEEEPIAPR